MAYRRRQASRRSGDTGLDRRGSMNPRATVSHLSPRWLTTVPRGALHATTGAFEIPKPHPIALPISDSGVRPGPLTGAGANPLTTPSSNDNRGGIDESL